jgi:hypothetical protein
MYSKIDPALLSLRRAANTS